MTYLVYLNSLIRSLIVFVTSFAATSALVHAYQKVLLAGPDLPRISGIHSGHSIAALAVWNQPSPAQAVELQGYVSQSVSMH